MDYAALTDEELYRHIICPEIIQTNANIRKLGFEKFIQNPLVLEVRKRCEQNLWFLGKYFLWDTDVFGAGKPIEENFFCEHVHRRLCDMFVVKDKTKPIGQQDWRKERIILYPRYTGKSAWDRYDVVQWILNFPDIRILYLTATLSLAEGFVGETKSHFVIRENDDGNLTLMNQYFPEFCFNEKESGKANEFSCPAATWVKKGLDRKDKTIKADSIDATGTGGHWDVIKADDAVSEQNSGNEVQCKKVSTAFAQKHKTLNPVGYADKIGTRYADEDMYGVDLQKNVGTNIEKQSGDNWEIIDNKDLGLRVLIGRSIVIKPETRERLERENKPVSYKEAGSDGCTLLFPELHTYSWCMSEYSKDEIIFEGQQNQNPRSAVNPVFDRPLMMKHTIPFNDRIVPQSGPVSVFWDFAFSKAKGRDYCTGSAAIWNAQRQCIFIDMIRAKFKPLELAVAFVEFARKHRPYVIGVEDAGGSNLIHPSIVVEAYKTKDPYIIDVCNRINWVKPSNQKDAKKSRMRALHPWIAGDMMYFLNTLPYLDTMYEEFERCLGDHHHDDIPDNFSYQPNYAPSMMQAIMTQEIDRFSRPDGAWSYLFDTSGELYGNAENFFQSPFQGMRLINDPDNPGVLKWVSSPIQNPLVNLPTEEEMTVQYDHGLDSVLGAL
jgi:hypothetical protein